jgi:2-polyprenylphenol 6-hydroxylase
VGVLLKNVQKNMSLLLDSGVKPADQYDVAVIGCGVVGLVAALVLASAGHRVLLVGQKPVPFVPSDAQRFDPRVFALSHRSQRMLDTLRVWGNIPSDTIQAVHDMQVWGDSHGTDQGELSFSASETGVQALTWIVEQRSLLAVLLSAIGYQPRIDCLDANAEHLQRNAHGWLVTTAQKTVQVPLLIAADGVQSRTRRAAGLDFDIQDYQSEGVVGTFSTEKPHQGVARQWFDGRSILALLPLPGNHVSMVWSMPLCDAHAFVRLAPQPMADRLQAVSDGAVHRLYGNLSACGQAHAFPLRHGVAPVWFENGVVLMGDAAHVVHPLSGQGLNLGLEDVAELAQLLASRQRTQSLPLDLADAQLWRAWARRRKAACLPMQVLTKGLHTLFCLDVLGASFVRNKGMQWVNQLPMVKRWLSQRAMR